MKYLSLALCLYFAVFTTPALAQSWNSTPMEAFREEGWVQTSLYAKAGWWLTLFGGNDTADIELKARSNTFDFKKEAAAKPWLRLVLDGKRVVKLDPRTPTKDAKVRTAIYAFDTSIRITLQGNKKSSEVRALFKAIADAKQIEVTFPIRKGQKTVSFQSDNNKVVYDLFMLK